MGFAKLTEIFKSFFNNFNMKALKLLLLLFLFEIGIKGSGAPPANNQQSNQGNGQAQGQNGQGGQSGQPGQNNDKKPTQLNCLNDVIRSYLLRGRFKSEQDKMVLCPPINNNCCTKLDQQRIYHIVNDILPQRVLEYQSKMKMALAKLKKLHEKIIKNKPSFAGSPRRRMFCGTASRKVYNFAFTAFYDKTIDDLESIRHDLDEYYKTFFCNICDAENHPHIALKTKKITIDGEFCQTFIQEHEEMVQMLNIELVEYLESLQHLVDCNHYLRSYNLKFFDTKKQEFAKDVGKCINNLNSKNFLRSCKTTCESIMLSKINPLVEGDFEFLIDAVNLFDKFFQYKESGNFISMKLRLFFKKFIIPRKLSKEKRARYLKQLKERERQEANRKLPVVDRKLTKSKTVSKKIKSQKPKATKAQKPVRKLKNVKSNRKSRSQRDRHLLEVGSQQTNDIENKVTGVELGNGRILNATNNQGGGQGDNKSGDQKSNGPPVKKAKKAQLIYNKELFHFYSEIKVLSPVEKVYVFKVRPQPIDIDKLTKTFAMHDGINPTRFINTTKFGLPPTIFYKQLFSYRKPDQPDPTLLFFLADFKPKTLQEITKDIGDKFKIEVPKKKKQKKTRRILSLLDRSEKNLNENFLKKGELKDVNLLKPNN